MLNWEHTKNRKYKEEDQINDTPSIGLIEGTGVLQKHWHTWNKYVTNISFADLVTTNCSHQAALTRQSLKFDTKKLLTFKQI